MPWDIFLAFIFSGMSVDWLFSTMEGSALSCVSATGCIEMEEQQPHFYRQGNVFRPS